MNHDTEAHNNSPQKELRPRPYGAPRLRVYGALQDLTTSGTGSKVENNPKGQGNKRP